MVKGVPASEEEIAYMRKLAEEHPDWTGDKICLQSFRDEKSDTLRHKSFLTQHDIRLAEIRASQLEEERGEAEMKAEGVGYYREFDWITERLRRDDLDSIGKEILEAMRTRMLYEVSERDELMQEREQLIENVKYLKERTEDYKKEKSEAWTDYYNTKKKLDAEIKRLSAEIEALRKARAGFGEVERQIKLHNRTIERIRRLKRDEIGEVRYIVSKVLQAQGHRFSSSEFIISNMSEKVYGLIAEDVERGCTVERSWGKVATFTELKSQVRSLESIVNSLEATIENKDTQINLLTERNQALKKQFDDGLEAFKFEASSKIDEQMRRVEKLGEELEEERDKRKKVERAFEKIIRLRLWEQYEKTEEYSDKVPKLYTTSGLNVVVKPDKNVEIIEEENLEAKKKELELEGAEAIKRREKEIEIKKAKEKTEAKKNGKWVLVEKPRKKEPSFYGLAKKVVAEDLKHITDFTRGILLSYL